jgi:hypothetical protein
LPVKKYSHLVKKLNFQKGPVGSYVWSDGSGMEGLNLSFGWFFANKIGDLSVCKRSCGQNTRHAHPFGECLIFAGLDYNHPNDLGAEIELSLGDKASKYTIASPSAVAVSAGLPHNPVVTRKLTRPFGALAISLYGKYHAADAPVKNTPLSTQDPRQLIKRLELKDMQRKSGGNADYIAAWNGKGMPGFDLNFTWAFHKGTGTWHKRDPHVHPYDEILLFVGCDPDNPEYLGAEIEIALGKEQEKHVFNTSTVIVAPKELVHCPLNTRKVDQPYCFSAICLNNEHITTWLGEDTGIGL